MRGTALAAFAFFVVSGGGAPLDLENDNAAGVAVVIESDLLRAAGSMSMPGIAGTWYDTRQRRLVVPRAAPPHQETCDQVAMKRTEPSAEIGCRR